MSALKVYNRILYLIRYCTGSQCKETRTGVICSCFRFRDINRAAVFCTRWSITTHFHNLNVKSLANWPTFCKHHQWYKIVYVLILRIWRKHDLETELTCFSIVRVLSKRTPNFSQQMPRLQCVHRSWYYSWNHFLC